MNWSERNDLNQSIVLFSDRRYQFWIFWILWLKQKSCLFVIYRKKKEKKLEMEKKLNKKISRNEIDLNKNENVFFHLLSK